MTDRLPSVKKGSSATLFQVLCILGTHLTLVAPFSPPGCPCRQRNAVRNCPPLLKTGCEVVYDYCSCCPLCALGLGQTCQEFRTPCKKGLICLWDRFWYEEPLSGKCAHGGYIKPILHDPLKVVRHLNGFPPGGKNKVDLAVKLPVGQLTTTNTATTTTTTTADTDMTTTTINNTAAATTTTATTTATATTTLQSHPTKKSPITAKSEQHLLLGHYWQTKGKTEEQQ